jgi:phosphopantetheine adenylyltransferase
MIEVAVTTGIVVIAGLLSDSVRKYYKVKRINNILKNR